MGGLNFLNFRARNSVLAALLLTATPAAAQQPTSVAPARPVADYQRAIAAGYKAAMLCSGLFNAGRTPEQVQADELGGIYTEYQPLLVGLSPQIDRARGRVAVPFAADLPPRWSVWNAATGCTTMPIGWAPPSDARNTAMARPAPTRPQGSPADWPMGDRAPPPRPPRALADTVARAFDRASYGAGSKTVGVLVLRDGTIRAERYAEGFGPFTSNRTWSVAKSIAGTLIGAAIQQGVAIDPRRPASLSQWPAGDPRARITLDQLMRMASGLHSDTAGNRTDAIYFGGTAVTDQAPGWPLEAAPGTRFRYANNDILLAVLALRQRLGDQRYASFPRDALFAPLGMRNTLAETDWRGNYILSSQVWSTARDLGRLGQLWLQDGMWAGRRLLPQGWVATMTTPSGPQPAEGPGYGATMWLFGPEQGLPAGSFAAQGNRGQYVMVIPARRLVVVRRGEDPGPARFDIARFAADVAAALP